MTGRICPERLKAALTLHGFDAAVDLTIFFVLKTTGAYDAQASGDRMAMAAAFGGAMSVLIDAAARLAATATEPDMDADTVQTFAALLALARQDEAGARDQGPVQ